MFGRYEPVRAGVLSGGIRFGANPRTLVEGYFPFRADDTNPSQNFLNLTPFGTDRKSEQTLSCPNKIYGD
jgi:hypothetical protein